MQRRVNIQRQQIGVRPVLAPTPNRPGLLLTSPLFSSSSRRSLFLVLHPPLHSQFTMSSSNTQAPLPFGYQFVAGAVAGVSEVSGLI